jgi:hypothetical protein
VSSPCRCRLGGWSGAKRYRRSRARSSSLSSARCSAEAPSRSSASLVRPSPVGDDGGPFGGLFEERRDERGLDRRLHRHVEQDDGAPATEGASIVERIAGGREERGPVGGAAGDELRGRVLVESGQVTTALAGRHERVLRRGGHAQVGQGGRQCGRKAGHPRDRGEVRQAAGPLRLEHGARGDGLRAETGGRGQTLLGERRRREPRGELREAEAMDAEGRRPRTGQFACEVVGRAARGRDDEHFRGGRLPREEFQRPRAPGRGGGGDEDASAAHRWLSRKAAPGRRRRGRQEIRPDLVSAARQSSARGESTGSVVGLASIGVDGAPESAGPPRPHRCSDRGAGSSTSARNGQTGSG